MREVEFKFSPDGKRYLMQSPTLVPKADSFMWNEKMLCHITGEGFAQSQFMQPEPAFYAHPPMMAAKAAMAPEPQYFDHYPGRFFYVRDDETKKYYSAPFRPTNIEQDEYEFAPGLSDIQWHCKKDGIQTTLQFALPKGSEIVEVWRVTIKNDTNSTRAVSLFPYFPVGFPSWMNTEGGYNDEIGGMLAYTITPYRKLEDYYKNKNLKDYTYLVSDVKADYWEANLSTFEGVGGLRRPDALAKEHLTCTEAAYETTACILQYQMKLAAGEQKVINFIFGPANNLEEIKEKKTKFLHPMALEETIECYNNFYKENAGCLQVETGDRTFDAFVNHWLPRQALYHAYSLRMVTDQQTRNHIQDAMSMIYINPARAKELYLIGLRQQKVSGEMPDGILQMEGAELKYTNQIPHRDHSVWWAYALEAYLQETGDYDFLNEQVAFANGEETATIYEHVCRGIEWLVYDRSERGLCFIGQGDWNDPMNMVGYKGKGESVWLTQAMIYAMKTWLPLCKAFGDQARIDQYNAIIEQTTQLMNTLCWDGEWYARGITDDGVLMGVKTDEEGEIFLNTQSFGMLSEIADDTKLAAIMKSVEERLETSYGMVMLAPSYTHMREDVGRVTQKHPSTAENGSIYCHANAFYVYALYRSKQSADKAYQLLRRLLPGPDLSDLTQREHLPIYIPNYYRGSHNKRVIGKASHLMNTGSLPWIYRCITEGMFGLAGEQNGIRISPQLPQQFTSVKATRRFRGKTIKVTITRTDVACMEILFNGESIQGNFLEESRMQASNTMGIYIPKK